MADIVEIVLLRAGAVTHGYNMSQRGWGKDNDKTTDNRVTANQYSLAAHWRFATDGFQVAARGSYAFLSFDGKRFFRSTVSGEEIEREIEGNWNGNLFSVSAVASQELWAGGFFARPSAAIEYYSLTEDSYQEEGGGDALDLAVDKRKSDELAVTGFLIAGFEMGGLDEDEGYFRFEAEAGRRQIMGGSLGKTSARFTDGETFVLTPEERQSGWLGRLRAIGGDSAFHVAGEIGAEEREDRVGLSARASIALGF